MSEQEFEESLITLTDEDGQECQFEVIGTFAVGDEQYMALIPADSDDDECVLLKTVTDENGELVMVTIDDDDEFERAAAAFEEEYMGDCDLDETYEDSDESDD